MIMRELAPIVLFVYNRLEHTRRTIDALKRNTLAAESDLYIFSDGPKIGEEDKIETVRDYLNKITGFNNIYVIEREKNLGLANSVIAGVSEVVEKYGKVIVLEDDLVCSPDFLQYMNNALDKYQFTHKVFSITGYSFFHEKDYTNLPDSYFLKLTSSWSWATWRDRWQYFDEQALGYKRLMWDHKLRRRFNYDNTYNYYSMLIAQMQKKVFIHIPFLTKKRHVDSWAVRWYWAVFKQEGLTLFPRDSFVKNIGFDGSGAHCGSDSNSSLNTGIWNEEFKYEELAEEQKWIREKLKTVLLNV